MFAPRQRAAIRRVLAQGRACVYGRSVRALLVLAFLAVPLVPSTAQAQLASPPLKTGPEPCTRPAEGSVVPETKEVQSQAGLLRLELAFRNFRAANGEMRYCYTMADGTEAPTLRLKPGDTLVLRIKNEVVPDPVSDHPGKSPGQPMTHSMTGTAEKPPPALDYRCHGGVMSAWVTNVHFHGLMLPPVADDRTKFLKTLIQPGDRAFEYRFEIPVDTPPGLYWYHPHPHGFTGLQVRGELPGPGSSKVSNGMRRYFLAFPNASWPSGIRTCCTLTRTR